MKCKHQYDGKNLICPFGCHSNGEKPDLNRVAQKTNERTFFPKSKPDLTVLGEVYGQLTLVERIDNKFRCKCSCGNICVKYKGHLKDAVITGQIPACDECLKKRPRKPSQIIGKVFGHMTVKKSIQCQCKCSNISFRVISDMERFMAKGGIPMCASCRKQQ